MIVRLFRQMAKECRYTFVLICHSIFVIFSVFAFIVFIHYLVVDFYDKTPAIYSLGHNIQFYSLLKRDSYPVVPRNRINNILNRILFMSHLSLLLLLLLFCIRWKWGSHEYANQIFMFVLSIPIHPSMQPWLVVVLETIGTYNNWMIFPQRGRRDLLHWSGTSASSIFMYILILQKQRVLSIPGISPFRVILSDSESEHENTICRGLRVAVKNRGRTNYFHTNIPWWASSGIRSSIHLIDTLYKFTFGCRWHLFPNRNPFRTNERVSAW